MSNLIAQMSKPLCRKTHDTHCDFSNKTDTYCVVLGPPVSNQVHFVEDRMSSESEHKVPDERSWSDATPESIDNISASEVVAVPIALPLITEEGDSIQTDAPIQTHSSVQTDAPIQTDASVQTDDPMVPASNHPTTSLREVINPPSLQIPTTPNSESVQDAISIPSSPPSPKDEGVSPDEATDHSVPVTTARRLKIPSLEWVFATVVGI